MTRAAYLLVIEPRRDGRAWELDFHEVRRSLDRAVELLQLPRESTDPA